MFIAVRIRLRGVYIVLFPYRVGYQAMALIVLD